MTTLHIISRSPYGHDDLTSCLRLLSSGDGLLLCGDAVYAARTHLDRLPENSYLLEEDCLARGLNPHQRLRQVDYAGFVALCCDYNKVNTWL